MAEKPEWKIFIWYSSWKFIAFNSMYQIYLCFV